MLDAGKDNVKNPFFIQYPETRIQYLLAIAQKFEIKA